MIDCKECKNPAVVIFMWPTSRAPQRANFCDACAKGWWEKYRHTPSGLCLSIKRIVQQSSDTNSDTGLTLRPVAQSGESL